MKTTFPQDSILRIARAIREAGGRMSDPALDNRDPGPAYQEEALAALQASPPEIACIGLELPADVEPGALAECVAILKAIAASAGNLPDDRLESRTGPNDAVARGIMVTSMRSLAVEVLTKHKLGLPAILKI